MRMAYVTVTPRSTVGRVPASEDGKCTVMARSARAAVEDRPPLPSRIAKAPKEKESKKELHQGLLATGDRIAGRYWQTRVRGEL